jgi:hypothetical protein
MSPFMHAVVESILVVLSLVLVTLALVSALVIVWVVGSLVNVCAAPCCV